MKAKVLDLDWLTEFVVNKETGELTSQTKLVQFMQILTETSNDAVFATQLIKLFIDYLWERFFDKILNELFLPYVYFFCSFQLLAIYFSNFHVEDGEELTMFFKILSLFVYAAVFYLGFNYIKLELREMAESQKRDQEQGISKWSSILDFQNVIDYLTILLVALFSIASFCELLFW